MDIATVRKQCGGEGHIRLVWWFCPYGLYKVCNHTANTKLFHHVLRAHVQDALLTLLANDFALSPQANNRKVVALPMPFGLVPQVQVILNLSARIFWLL